MVENSNNMNLGHKPHHVVYGSEYSFRTSDFDYHLPQELVAQLPCEKRDHSRLLVLERKTGRIHHHRFTDLAGFLKAGDCLVVNRSKVIPGRLIGKRHGTGGKVEILLLGSLGHGNWSCLLKPGRKLKGGDLIDLPGGAAAKVLERKTGQGIREIHLEGHDGGRQVIESSGIMPLPPYIRYDPALDEFYRERYQTVYAKTPGSSAAPTAGLHFSKEVLLNLQKKGIRRAGITLHVGAATFRPIKEENPVDHPVAGERFSVSPTAAGLINTARNTGKRVAAVGTTSLRAIESCRMDSSGGMLDTSGTTELYVLPGFDFRFTDILITNFHLPRSTLLMLVCAFAGRDNVLNAYNEAVREGYRFYSFGDAMCII